MQIGATNSTNATTAEIPDWVFDCLKCDEQYRKFFITKGIGSGGTYGACLWHLVMCAINSESVLSWFVAPTFSQIMSPVIPTFCDILTTKFGMQENVDFQVRVGSSIKLLLRNSNQVIAFKSANKPGSLVAASISHLTGTELPFWPEESFQRAVQRVRCPKATRLQSMFEFAPEGAENWASNLCDFPPGLNKELNAERVILWTADNKHQPPGYIKSLEDLYGYDQNRLRAYLYGEITPFSKSTAYWEYRPHLHVGPTKPARILPLRISWDFNLSPIAWVAIQKQPMITLHKQFYVYSCLAESSGHSRGLLDACAEIVATFPPQYWANTEIEIDGDPAGHAGHVSSGTNPYDIIKKYLRQFYPNLTVVAPRSAPSIQARLERTNQLFAYNRVVIDPRCEMLKGGLRDTQLKKGQWEILKPPNDKHTHHPDAASYGLFNLAKDDILDGNRVKKRGWNR